MERIDKLFNVLIILAVLKAVWKIGLVNSAILVVGALLIKAIVVDGFLSNGNK